MKRFFGALAGAAMMMAPVAMQAQAVDEDVSVFISDDRTYDTGGRGYGGSGGGFFATFTVEFGGVMGTRSFTDYLIWCIDAGRSVALNTSTTYEVYRLADFADGDFGSSNGHDPDLGDMTRLASLQSAMANNWFTPGFSTFDHQGSIWSEFDGYANYGDKESEGPILAGNPNFDVSEYYVFWNGKDQTFLTKISEPSSALLAFAGMGAFLVAVRRRRVC